ncbi:hypothetical protein BCR44DRAFT_1429110 [Catenaria anguillulae PL171]|uniref:F-box domain-containing protein n=1 Tax=Catenaria anguillulae PL171 TaxID=765915 RepID=A0A1Y2HV24_9FUNG|nr:hypothetical protein BCR44DRAFT_1429110 [Catenaria anguillulae PL171]
MMTTTNDQPPLTLTSLPSDALDPCLSRYLSPADLTQLALTCRAARDLAIPHLYRHLILPNLPALPRLHATLSTRPDLARHVVTITAGAPMMMDLAQFDFRQLLNLKKLVPGSMGLFMSLGFLDLANVLRKRQAWIKGSRVYPLSAVMAYDPLLRNANGHAEKTPYFVTFIDFKRKIMDVTNEQPLPMLSALIVYPWFEVIGTKDKNQQAEWRIRNAVIAQQGGDDRPQNDAWFARGKEVEVLEKSGIRMHEDHVYDLCAAPSPSSSATTTAASPVTASPKSKRNPRMGASKSSKASASPSSKFASTSPPVKTPGLTGSVSAFMATAAAFSTIRSNPLYPESRVTRIQLGGEAAWIQRGITNPMSKLRALEKYSTNMLAAFTKVLSTPWTTIRHLEFTESYFLGIFIRHVLGVLDPLLRRVPTKGRALRELHLMASDGRGGDGKCWMWPKDKTPLDPLKSDGKMHLKRLLVHDGNKSNRWDNQILIHPGMLHGLSYLSLTQCSMHVVTPMPTSQFAQSFPPVNGDARLPTIHIRHVSLANLTSLTLDAAKLYSSFTPSAASQWGAVPYMLPRARNLQYLALINMELMPVPAAPKFTPDHLLAILRKYPVLKQLVVRAAPFTRAHFEYLARVLFHPPPELSPLPKGSSACSCLRKRARCPGCTLAARPCIHSSRRFPCRDPSRSMPTRIWPGIPRVRESMPFQIGKGGSGMGAGSLEAKAWMSMMNPGKVVCNKCATDEVEWVGGKGEKGWRRVRLVEVLDEMPFLGIETWGLLM